MRAMKLSITAVSMRVLWLAALLASMAAQASTITYYHNDLAGSPVVATDASGHVLWRESYRPYGERLVNSAASKGNDVWFTSRRQDAQTGLVYMGARYYDPVAGRFVSMDPKGFDEANLHSFNRYAYANDNPYKYVDPDGKSPLILWGVFGYGAGVAADALSQYAAWGSVDLKMAASSSAALSGAQAGLLSPAGGAGVGLTIERVGAEVLSGQASARAAGEFADPKFAAQLERQLARDGSKSIFKSLNSLEKRLSEHEAKLSEVEFKTSVEREIRTFSNQIDTLKEFIRQQGLTP